MTFYGADVSQLRELAKAVDKAATLLSSRASSLQGQIQSAPWKGNDGEMFRQDWSGKHRPSLERVASSLRHNSKLLLQHANEQEKASDKSGGGSGGGSLLDRLKDLADRAKTWLQEQAQKAAEAKAHREELEQGLDDMLKASPEEQAKWWASLSEADRKYLIEGEGENGPFAEDLMKMDGGIPEAAQEQAREHLQELAKGDIPVYSETGTATLEARIAWVHGGAEVGTEVVENADGTATMTVHGKLGLGVNDGTGTAGATLNGQVSREYTFGSVEEARAALEQMYKDLPPDSAGDVKDVAKNAPDYVLDTINDAADDNGATGREDKAKGELSLEVKGEGGAAEGSAGLSLSYEKNLTDGTSTASGEASANGKLDMNGQIFEASGKGGMELNMDKDNNITSISLSMEGTVAQGLEEGVDIKAAKVESSITAGTQGTVKIDIDYSPENKALIDSYLRNEAMNNTEGAARDAAKLYDAGSATIQVNNVVTATNAAGIDLKAGEVSLKTENQITNNVTTYHKVPNDSKLQRL